MVVVRWIFPYSAGFIQIGCYQASLLSPTHEPTFHSGVSISCLSSSQDKKNYLDDTQAGTVSQRPCF